VRSLYTEENFYQLHRILEDQKPDLFFLVETWHQTSSPRALLDKNYSILLSNTSYDRGGGVAILHKSSFLVKPLFSELHSRNLLLARLSSSTSAPVLLLCIYVPPDHERRKEMHSDLCRVLDLLKSRYRSFCLVAFGDLNADLVNDPLALSSRKFSKLAQSYGLSLCSFDQGGAVTRVQGGKASCLDYFFTKGAEVNELTVGEKFGSSDHMTIQCVIEGFVPILRARRKFLSKDRARRYLYSLISEDKVQKFSSLGPVKFFSALSASLRAYATVFEPRPITHFRAVSIAEEEMGKPFPDWERIRRALRRCRGTEFLLFLEKARRFRERGELKEFHRIVGSILGLRKASLSVHEIEDPHDPAQVIY